MFGNFDKEKDEGNYCCGSC